MALITCPECGKKISEYAKHCPECGFPTQCCNIENNVNPGHAGYSNVNTNARNVQHAPIADQPIGVIQTIADKINNAPKWVTWAIIALGCFVFGFIVCLFAEGKTANMLTTITSAIWAYVIYRITYKKKSSLSEFGQRSYPEQSAPVSSSDNSCPGCCFTSSNTKKTNMKGTLIILPEVQDRYGMYLFLKKNFSAYYNGTHHKLVHKEKMIITLEEDLDIIFCLKPYDWSPIKREIKDEFGSPLIHAYHNEVKVVKVVLTRRKGVTAKELVLMRDGVKLNTLQDANSPSKISKATKIGLGVGGALLAGIIGSELEDFFDSDTLTNSDIGVDGDDTMDSIGIDSDGDGVLDSIAMDSDGDGVLDSIAMDSDGDGVLDSIAMDSDGDGILDSIAMDSDGDGALDSIAMDSDGDGALDTIAMDSDGDGTLDTMAIDTDGDGVENIVGIDSNNDGVFDTVSVDANGDGLIDNIAIDRNFDGVFDTIGVDTDNSGAVDSLARIQ